MNQLAVAAATLYGLMDFVFSWNPLAAAPYFAHRQDAVFRAVPALALGVVAEALNGWIAALAFALIEPALVGSSTRRGLLFGGIIWGFWVISGTFSAFVWLNVPASLALTNVLFGLPKCLAIGCGVAWFWQKRIGPASC